MVLSAAYLKMQFGICIDEPGLPLLLIQHVAVLLIIGLSRCSQLCLLDVNVSRLC